MRPTTRSPTPSANNSSVTAGESDTMRRAGCASATRRPASSLTVSAAAPPRGEGEACSDPRHATSAATTTARCVRSGERRSTVPPTRDFSRWRERGRLLASGERLAFPVIPVALSRAALPVTVAGPRRTRTGFRDPRSLERRRLVYARELRGAREASDVRHQTSPSTLPDVGRLMSDIFFPQRDYKRHDQRQGEHTDHHGHELLYVEGPARHGHHDLRRHGGPPPPAARDAAGPPPPPPPQPRPPPRAPAAPAPR